jgi:hypothetical protein
LQPDLAAAANKLIFLYDFTIPFFPAIVPGAMPALVFTAGSPFKVILFGKHQVAILI